MAGGAGSVVVGVDGSPGSAAALCWSLAEAEATGRGVVAVTAGSTAVAAAHRRAPEDQTAGGARMRQALVGSVGPRCLRRPVVVLPVHRLRLEPGPAG